MYMKKFFLYIVLVAFPLLAKAQASGGQITRKSTAQHQSTLAKPNTKKETLGYYSKEYLENKEFYVNGVCFTMVGVQGGVFTMGATLEQGNDSFTEEKPVHKVAVNSFRIGKTEVTQELWTAVMGNNPSRFKGGNLPVECIDWASCKVFIEKLNAMTNMHFRLPTEAEWEYASRGGENGGKCRYSGGNSINEVAWFSNNSSEKTHIVGTKSPNEFGIYDLSGNVQEWCEDYYSPYEKASQTNPTGPSNGVGWRKTRIIRGGSCNDIEYRCRICVRFDLPESGYYNEFTGMRLAL